MSYIIMGRDECGDEFRPEFPAYSTEEKAEEHFDDARERYPEAQSMWVEIFKDKSYYQRQNRARYENDTYDIY